MKTKIITLCIGIALLFSLIGCKTTSPVNEEKSQDGKINVTVSFYPLKEFTEQIGGDKVNVTTLVPDNMEPHDYEPKTKDFVNLVKSDLMIYNGLGLETWIDEVNEAIKEESVTIVDSSTGIQPINITDEEHDEEHEEEYDYKHDGTDPHIWLSLKNAQIQCKNIKDALIQADSSNAEYYEKNYETYIKKINDLYNKYDEKFNTVKNKDFITGHAAFAYLCRDFNLKQQSVENVFGEGEPTPKKLEELVDYCKKNNIKTIFSESLASPKVSETLASEVGAQVVPIYTLESQEDNKDYISAMEYNLDKIYNALAEQSVNEN